MNKILLSLFCAANVMTFSLHAYADDQKNSVVSNHDCVQAQKDCLLSVKFISSATQQKAYQIKNICSGKNEYQYIFDLKYQLANQIFLGNKFCNGTVSLSTMELPFVLDYNALNANDGKSLMEFLRTVQNALANDLQTALDLAHQAKKLSCDQPGNAQDCDHLNNEFQVFKNDIHRNIQYTTFAGYALLSGQKITIHRKNELYNIMITLPNMQTSITDFSSLNLLSDLGVTKALEALNNAMPYVNQEFESALSKSAEIDKAREQDAVVTEIDLNDPAFISIQTKTP